MRKETFHEYLLRTELLSIKKSNDLVVLISVISFLIVLLFLILFTFLSPKQNHFHKNLKNDLPNIYSLLQDYQKVVLCNNLSIEKVSKSEIIDIVNYSPEYARLHLNNILLPKDEYEKFKQEKLKENCK